MAPRGPSVSPTVLCGPTLVAPSPGEALACSPHSPGPFPPAAASRATSTTACPCSTPRTSRSPSRQKAQRTSPSAGVDHAPHPGRPPLTPLTPLTPGPTPGTATTVTPGTTACRSSSGSCWPSACCFSSSSRWVGPGEGGGAQRLWPPPSPLLGPRDLPTGPCPCPQHVALCIKLIAAWFVPDVPQSVKNKVLEEKYRALRDKMW